MCIRSIALAACMASAGATVWPSVSISPSTSTSNGNVAEGMQAFGEFSDSQFVDIPEELVNTDHLMLTFDAPVAANTQFTIKCPSNIEGDTCQIYVFTYHCPPCSLHGGLPAVLLAAGWEAGSCAPHFVLEENGNKHEMAAFRKVMDKGTAQVFSTTQVGRFIAMAGTPVGTNCADQNSQLTCTNTRHCSWTGTVCEDGWCPRRHLPSQAPIVCNTCAGDDVGSGSPPVASPVSSPVEPPVEPPVAPPTSTCSSELNYGSLCSGKEECCKGSMTCKWTWVSKSWKKKCKY